MVGVPPLSPLASQDPAKGPLLPLRHCVAWPYTALACLYTTKGPAANKKSPSLGDCCVECLSWRCQGRRFGCGLGIPAATGQVSAITVSAAGASTSKLSCTGSP
jgi:hypothetical protein